MDSRKTILIVGVILLALIFFFLYRADQPISDSQPRLEGVPATSSTEMENINVPEEQTNGALLNQRGEFNTLTQDIEYFDGVTGYYASPAEDGTYPGVIMIHEWWGLNDHIKDMADTLASHGYKVLAVDLFGAVATTPDEARAQVSGLDQETAIRNMEAAKAYLVEQNVNRIGSLGWCFGGGQSLQLSLNEELDATVIYYGNITSNTDELSTISWPVLGIFGSEDTSIPVEDVQNFEQSLDELNIQNDINIYDGVGHAFANPSGANYAPEETRDAWSKTLEFLETNLK